MKGIILDYTPSETFILLDDDSVITLPTNSFSKLSPIGSSINLSTLYDIGSNTQYHNQSLINNSIELL